VAIISIDAQGVFALSLSAPPVVEVTFPQLGFKLRAIAAECIGGKRRVPIRRKVVLPAGLRRGLLLPMEVEAEIAAYEGDASALKKNALAIPLGGVLKLNLEVKDAGGGSIHVVVPPVWARGISASGWGSHVQVTVGDRTFVGYLRESTGPHTTTFLALYRSELPEIKPGQELAITISPIVRPTKPATGVTEDGIDWLAFCDQEVVEQQDRLVFTNPKGQRFEMSRRTPLVEPAWLLGFYQAEGSKSAEGCEWTLTNKSAVYLSRVASILSGALAIPHNSISISTSHGEQFSPEDARERYAGLGVKFVGRPRCTSEREFAGTLHVMNGLPLKHLFEQVLAAFLDEGAISSLPRAALKAFALGFLDGDGTITGGGGNIRLGASGGEIEVLAAHRYLASAAGWPTRELKYKNASDGTSRYLSLSEAIDLLEADAFWPMYSRVRLLYAVDEKVQRIRKLAADPNSLKLPHIQARWGYLERAEGGWCVPEEASRQAERFRAFDEELAATRAVAPRAVVGKKGVENPLALERYSHGQILPGKPRALDDHTRARLVGAKVLVFVSGGKDSTAAALFLKEQGIDFEPVFIDTGWEAEDTYYQIRHVLPTHFGEIKWLRTGGLPGLLRAQGMFPSKRHRICTVKLKLEPAKQYIASLVGTAGEVVQVVGIRSRESESRARMSQWDWSEELDCAVWRPVLSWSYEDVVEIHKRHGVPPNPLYLKGFRRVGCFPCIFTPPKELVRIADMSPQRIAEIRDLERDVGGTFFLDHEGERLLIDEAVARARCGKLMPLMASEGCMRWGLCETGETGETEDEVRQAAAE
jgi:3'-phosphoadenosine 5'-phosphosulfate sulfotransferase (PAPS reductase)/FAD synthetase